MKIVLLITVVESFIVASLLVLWRLRKNDSKVAAARGGRSPVPALENPTTREVVQSPGDSRWAFISDWKLKPQQDDRRPAFGRIAYSNASASAHRSTSRRRHQEAYKAWSKARHE